jgi:hypothetical protein
MGVKVLLWAQRAQGSIVLDVFEAEVGGGGWLGSPEWGRGGGVWRARGEVRRRVGVDFLVREGGGWEEINNTK